MARVFISYADDGRDQAREVHQWLVEAGHDVFLDRDRRNGIVVGDQWRERLHERLRWADVVVCVVTSAYRESRWCAAEVEIARSRGSRLLPLQAESGVRDPGLESVQHIDLVGDPAAAQVDLVAVLRRVDAAGGGGWPDDRSPFPGLAAFEIDQHRVFFGRAGEIKELAELLRSPDVRTGGAALMLVGPSGCGKSSLVRAGLVPVMADEPGWWTLSPIVPGADPVAALARELAAVARRIGLGWTVAQVHWQLDHGGVVGLVGELLLATPGGPRRRLLIVVDQIEELLTQTVPAARARFIALLRPMLGGLVQLVATLRSEFLDPLLSDPALGGVATRTYTVRPLGREALRAVIEQPARVAGIGVDPALVTRLVEDTGIGEALPLLAFTLAQLAEGVRRGGGLSVARYDQLGGVQGALTRQADAALAAAIAATGRSWQAVIAGVLRLVTVDEQGRPSRWRIRRDQLPTPVAIELHAFVERRLLTTDKADGSGVIGVAHEAFLFAWPPLRDAIAASVSALRARRGVEHAAIAWHHNGRPPDHLWGGGQLAAAVADTGARLCRPGPAPPTPLRSRPSPGAARSLPRHHRVLVTDRVDLSPTARDFLHTSMRRDRFRRRRGVTVLSVLLVLALVGAGIAVLYQQDAQTQQQNAQNHQRIATARQLVAQADAIRATDPRTALQLGIAAQHIHPGAETQSSLAHTLTNTRYAGTLTAHTEEVNSVAFAPDRRMLATAGSDGTVILWDLAGPARPHQLGSPLAAHTDGVNSVAFAPGGRMLATAGSDGTMILWDLAEPSRPHQLSPRLTVCTDSVLSVAFAPDGRTLATASSDCSAVLWDLTNPAQPRQLGLALTAHTDEVNSVAFAPDGRTLATASSDGTVILWDFTNPAQPHQLGSPLTAHTDEVNSVAFAPDGRALATAGSDDRVILWDFADPAQPRQLGTPLTAHTGDVDSVAFAPDGHTLATASYDGTVLLWDLTNPAQPNQLGQPLGHTGSVRSVAFASDGQTLAAPSFDGTVLLWDLTNPALPRSLGPSLTARIDWVKSITAWLESASADPMKALTVLTKSVAFAPTWRTLATPSFDGTVLLWDLTDPARPRQLGPPLTTHTDVVTSSVFSSDGRTLATASLDGTVLLWDLTDPARPRQLGPPLTTHTNAVTSLAFSPDGHTLIIGSLDGTVLLWDLTNPAQPRQLGPPLTTHTILVSSVAFSPDGRTLATGSADGTVLLWDLTDPARPRQLGRPLIAHTVLVSSVAFSPNGHTLATASLVGTVSLWNLTNPAQPHQFGPPLTAHTDAVFSVAFALDGRTLATGSLDGTVSLWETTNPAQPHQLGPPLTAHPVWVSSVAFAPEGRTFATTSFDGTVSLWDLSGLNDLREHVVQRACAITGRGLDRDEWARYVLGLPYQDTCSD